MEKEKGKQRRQGDEMVREITIIDKRLLEMKAG